MQKDRRWTDNKSALLNETNRVIRDALEDLKRLRACNETSKLMIRQSQRLIAEMSGGLVHCEIVEPVPATIPPTPRNHGMTWTPKQQAPSELLVAEARHVRARVMQAYQSCQQMMVSLTETRELNRRLVHEAWEVLRWDAGWRL